MIRYRFRSEIFTRFSCCKEYCTKDCFNWFLFIIGIFLGGFVVLLIYPVGPILLYNFDLIPDYIFILWILSPLIILLLMFIITNIFLCLFEKIDLNEEPELDEEPNLINEISADEEADLIETV